MLVAESPWMRRGCSWREGGVGVCVQAGQLLSQASGNAFGVELPCSPWGGDSLTWASIPLATMAVLPQLGDREMGTTVQGGQRWDHSLWMNEGVWGLLGARSTYLPLYWACPDPP